MRGVFSIVALAGICVLTSCAGYSSYAIDETPITKIDTSLYGIWHVANDTTSERYILVQAASDALMSIEKIKEEYGSVTNYIQDLNLRMEKNQMNPMDPLFINMEIRENEGKIKKEEDHVCYLSTIFSSGGVGYQQWNAFFSKVPGGEIMNIKYWDAAGVEGYFFVRLLEVRKDTISIGILSDPEIKKQGNSQAVRSYLQKNINNRSFYSDTLHLYRIKGGHFSLKEAAKEIRY